MRETYRFRLALPFAQELLGPGYTPARNPVTDEEEYFAEGVVGDTLYLKILESDQRLAAASGESLLLGWDSRYNRRSFTTSEVEGSKLLLLHLFSAAGAGDEYGTWYTQGKPADRCDAYQPSENSYTRQKTAVCALSSRQVGPLRFPFQKMRKGCDVFMLWSGELILSDRLAKLINDGGFKGAKIQTIWNTSVPSNSPRNFSNVPAGAELLRQASELGSDPDSRDSRPWFEQEERLSRLEKALWEQMDSQRPRGGGTASASSQKFSQLIIQSTPVTVSNKTLFGENPLRPQTGEDCIHAFGKIAGKRLLSALSVLESSWDGSDICSSDVFLGGRQGLFRPWRLLLISKRLFDAMRKEGMKGFDFEVVEMV